MQRIFDKSKRIEALENLILRAEVFDIKSLFVISNIVMVNFNKTFKTKFDFGEGDAKRIDLQLQYRQYCLWSISKYEQIDEIEPQPLSWY